MKRLFLCACAFVFLASMPIGASFAQDDCWGSDQKCSDGKYHDSQGKVQPDSCDNFGATGTGEVHDCKCARTTEPKVACDNDAEWEPGSDCKVYCRQHACKCKSMECS